MLPKWARSGSREQFLHCGLRKFRHSKSSVIGIQVIYTTRPSSVCLWHLWDNGSRLGRVMVECTLFMTHCLQLNLQLHRLTIGLVRTCRIAWVVSALLRGNWQDYYWQDASRRHSAIAELLVSRPTCNINFCYQIYNRKTLKLQLKYQVVFWDSVRKERYSEQNNDTSRTLVVRLLDATLRDLLWTFHMLNFRNWRKVFS